LTGGVRSKPRSALCPEVCLYEFLGAKLKVYYVSMDQNNSQLNTAQAWGKEISS